MSFFCPKCRAAIPGESTQVIACASCGLRIDLAALDTQHGQRAVASPLLLIRNHSGESLGRYRLLECLGLGGMGSVYKAIDTAANTVVAVKVLFAQLGLQPELVERFHREAAMLKELSHPNIVRFLEEGRDGSVHYLVMEYVEGETLERRLARPLPVAEVRDIIAQVGAALGAAHDKGIVHRDLKPANIILSSGGAKVVDFGVAHMAEHDFTLTQSDAVIGTFNYMAPEQRLRAKTIDHRADIFSLATIMYRMLTGTLPIGQYDAPSVLNREIGRGFDALIARALHPDPARRPQTIEAFLDALPSPTPSRRVWIAAASLTALLAIAGAGYGWLVPDPVTPAPASVLPPAPASRPIAENDQAQQAVMPLIESPQPQGKSQRIVPQKKSKMPSKKQIWKPDNEGQEVKTR